MMPLPVLRGPTSSSPATYPRLMDDEPPEGLLADLISLYVENRRLLGQLREARRLLQDALGYAARPDANAVLAQSRIDQLQARRHRLLAELRANRLLARRFIP